MDGGEGQQYVLKKVLAFRGVGVKSNDEAEDGVEVVDVEKEVVFDKE